MTKGKKIFILYIQRMVLILNSIVTISGSVKYKITLDPGVWIFDDRKVDLTTYFIRKPKENDEIEAYTKSVSKHWDREISEGAVYPPTLKTERRFEREKVLTGSFGIPLEPFLKNAEPLDHTTKVHFITTTGKITLSLNEAKRALLGFSNRGKPLTENGPVHLYYGNGSNADKPITSIREIILE